MIQYMRPLEDSVRIALLFGCPLGYPLWILYGCPLYSPSRMPLVDSVRMPPLFAPRMPLAGSVRMAPLFAPSGGPRSLYQRGYAPRKEVVDLVRVAVKYGVQKICHNCRIIVRFARQK